MEVIAACKDSRTSSIETIDGVKVYRLGTAFKVSTAPITLELPALLRQKSRCFDLLHFNFPNPWTDLLFLACCRRQKAILTYHGDIFRQGLNLSTLLLKAYRPFTHRLLGWMSAIVATSPKGVENSPFLSRRRERCRIIPMPVDLATFQGVEETDVAECWKKYGRFVLFVGRFVYYKGLSYLVEAMDRLEDSSVNLVLVGRGPLEESIREQVVKLGLGERVFFPGRVSDNELKTLYHACQCFVLPSITHAEALGMVLAEAMACGRPVVSTELGTGTSYVNMDGVTGFVVPPRDAAALAEKIGLLVGDGGLRKRLGSQGLARMKAEFSKESVVEKTLKLYEDVLAGKPVAQAQ
jgi:rhamnosyl/mannosyltransferase